MLRKLMKYELRATGRYFLPLYAMLLVLAVVNRIFFEVNFEYADIPRVIFSIGLFALIMGVAIMTLVVTIQRFYRNLLTDEGYLSFTLPVKASTHMNCKLIVSLVWDIVSVIAIILAILILTFQADMIQVIPKFFQELGGIFTDYTFSKIMLFLLVLLLMLAYSISFTVKIYAAIAIGNMSAKHKIILGIGTYIGFSICEQVIASIALIAMSNVPWGKWEWFVNLFQSEGNTLLAGMLALIVLVVFFAVLSVAYYAVTHHILTRKLNLE